jgi:hypothetical protein
MTGLMVTRRGSLLSSATVCSQTARKAGTEYGHAFQYVISALIE